jgi:hydrogenase maturation protein HypF
MVKDRVITTQHIGDMNELETLDYLRNSIKYILDTYNISKITRVAHDLNPAFLTTRLAKDLANSYGARTIPVQHHHAHFAALLAENQMPLDTHMIGITIDGVGYGYDGGAWGGELFHGTYGKIERVAHLKSQPMPGGDLCAYYPARMLPQFFQIQCPMKIF